uniref:Fusion protein n=1 Tax=Macrostomum lignano TaxID=282301 RepID=A0A1I8GM63_9PLAT
DHCANWNAGGRGHALTSASDVQRLDVFGCFCGSCRHGCIRYLADMTTPGEKLNYACAMVARALHEIPSVVPLVVSYDVSCKLKGHFTDDRGIRYNEGVGLTDGESSTWLNKRLALHRKTDATVTKDIALFLSKNYPTTTDFAALAMQLEKELRDTLRKCKKQDSNRTRTITRLHRLACEREFLMRHSLAERGQKLAKRLRMITSISIRKSNRIIRTYNLKVSGTRMLRYEDFCNPESSGFAAIGRVSLSPQMEAVRLYHLSRRVEEEPKLVKAEVRRVTNLLLTVCAQTQSQIDGLANHPATAVLAAKKDGLIHLLNHHFWLFPEERVEFESRTVSEPASASYLG